jgi:ABC-type glycerol-3-phosphate transport system permease component
MPSLVPQAICVHAGATVRDVFLASLLISMALPLALFLVFQRLFLRSVGLGGAVTR